MPSLRISADLNDGIYFLTFTTKHWYYLFDRHHRWEILADSLEYCRKHKGLQMYGYVFMLNHIHLVVGSRDISGFVRDFKRYTSQELQKNILATEPKMLPLLRDADGGYSVWQDTNMPIRMESEPVFMQKLNYMHENPVRKQYVTAPEAWYWSSANTSGVLRMDDWME